jgi:hypothetical protein
MEAFRSQLRQGAIALEPIECGQSLTLVPVCPQERLVTRASISFQTRGLHSPGFPAERISPIFYPFVLNHEKLTFDPCPPEFFRETKAGVREFALENRISILGGKDTATAVEKRFAKPKSAGRSLRENS